MILDNENNNLKVHEWISKYTDQGELDIVTGYFTIGALAWLSQNVNVDFYNQHEIKDGHFVVAHSSTKRKMMMLKEISKGLNLNLRVEVI